MPIGAKVRETGLLLRGSRGFVLRRDDGGKWQLDLARKYEALVGMRVSVSGVRSGFDLIDVIDMQRA